MTKPRRAALVFTFLLLIVISVLGADPWIYFGAPDDKFAMIAVGFDYRPGSGLAIRASNVQNVLRDQTVLKRTGGGLLVSTAMPAKALVNAKLNLRYIPSNQDGKRFEVTVENRKAYLSLFDWEAKPLAKFVQSGHHGAINATLTGMRVEIELDDAFQQSLLGLRIIQADLLPRNVISSQKYLPRDRTGIIFGNGERQWYGSDASIDLAMQSLAPLLLERKTPYSVLTDAGEQFTFYLLGDLFVIEGTPYYYWWNPDGEMVVPNEGLNQRFRASWFTLKQANPVVIRAVERAFRATAFFRYQQQHNPDNWSSFLEQVSRITIPTVPTPQRLEKSVKD